MPRVLLVGIAQTVLLIAGPQAPISGTKERAEFEAASVKVNKTGEAVVGMFPSPGMLRIRNYTLRLLIETAYKVSSDQIRGGPPWLAVDHFDVVAKASRNAGLSQMRPMLVNLLAERFRLATHWETKEVPMYALVVARGGPKIFQSRRDDTAAGGLRIGSGLIIGHKIPLTSLAGALKGELGRPVLDETALNGDFDFELHYSVDEDVRRRSEEDSASSDLNPGSLYTAIREQLGLRLVPRKGLVRVIVVDHAERPSQN